jgi:hypothetical protein
VEERSGGVAEESSGGVVERATDAVAEMEAELGALQEKAGDINKELARRLAEAGVLPEMPGLNSRSLGVG